MGKGVTLLAIGDKSYGYWAYNMGMSLKTHSPSLPVQLVHDVEAISDLMPHKLKMFDEFTEIKKEDSTTRGKINPSLAKLSLYKYLKFKETIYLDVDGITTQNLSGLFDRCEGLGFATQVVGTARKGTTDFHEMQWAEVDEVFEKYNLPDDAVLPATNSSFMYIKKGREASKIFRDALQFYHEPITKLKLKWGRGDAQPDELYLNASLAKNGFTEIGVPGYFRTKRDKPDTRSVTEITDEFYFIGLWGNKEMNSTKVTGTGQKRAGLYNILTWANGQKLFGSDYRIEYDYFRLEKRKFYYQK
jgi:hypothetical protein